MAIHLAIPLQRPILKSITPCISISSHISWLVQYYNVIHVYCELNPSIDSVRHVYDCRLLDIYPGKAAPCESAHTRRISTYSDPIPWPCLRTTALYSQTTDSITPAHQVPRLQEYTLIQVSAVLPKNFANCMAKSLFAKLLIVLPQVKCCGTSVIFY